MCIQIARNSLPCGKKGLKEVDGHEIARFIEYSAFGHGKIQ